MSNRLTDYLDLHRNRNYSRLVAADSAIILALDTSSASGSSTMSGAPPEQASKNVINPSDQPPRQAMNRLVMNYLVTEGFKEAAEKFHEESGLAHAASGLSRDQAMWPMDGMDARIKVRDAIQQGRINDAIDMVNQLHPDLLDDDTLLFFHLQQQQLIELIRENRLEEALKYAACTLADRGEENQPVLEEIERTMALLAFEDPTSSPFADLLSPSHRQKVASELNSALLKAEHAECTQPKLAGLLKLLLWSQSELDKKGIRYNKIIDLASGKMAESK